MFDDLGVADAAVAAGRAWRLGLRLAETLAGGSDCSLDRYASEQRAAAGLVQRDNARIFANIAVRSVPAAALRAAALHAAAHLPAVAARMARSEALLPLPPVAGTRAPAVPDVGGI